MKINEFCRHANITQRELAQAAQLGEVTLSRIANGHICPTALTLARLHIATAGQVSLFDIVDPASLKNVQPIHQEV